MEERVTKSLDIHKKSKKTELENFESSSWF